MSSKGISPVVASVLLLSISIGAVAATSVFLSGELNNIQSTFERMLTDETIEDQADITVNLGYDRNGYIWLDVENTGEVSLQVEENNDKKWSIFVDGAASQVRTDWKYQDGSVHKGQKILNPDNTIRINTTVRFPTGGTTKTLRIEGPHDLSAAISCSTAGVPDRC